MRVVRLGNPQPVHHATGEQLDGGDRITEVHLPDGLSVGDAVTAITHRGTDTHGVWAVHSAADAPSWVWSDDAAVAAALAAHYGCEALDTDPRTDEET